VKQAKELMDRRNIDTELSNSGDIAIAGNDDNNDNAVPKEEAPTDESK
jgi:hypothetical protein